MIKNYFFTAWRSIFKNGRTSMINLAGLSAGMSAAVLIFLWVQNETSFDNYTDRKDIYRLTTRLPSAGWVWETTPLLLADAIRSEVPGVEKVTRLYTSNAPVFNIKNNPFYEKACAYVDNDWFAMFHYQFISGDSRSFNQNPFSVILTATTAKKYFGRSNVVGQSIHIDSVNYIIRGIVEDAPANSSFQYNAFLPLAALLTNPQIRANDEQWNNANYITFIKARTGSKPSVLSAGITAVLRKKSNDETAAPVDLIALPAMHFETEISNSAFKHGNYNTVYIFSFLGFLLLLIACINYVNLTTARASLRAKEVGIRKISGASRTNLFFQFMAESVLISMMALITTIALVQLCLPAFNQLTGSIFTLPLTSIALWKVLGITLASALLLNSVYPALLLSSFRPLQVLKGVTMLKVKTATFRKSLVVLQFTVSVILIAGTIIIYRQMQFVQKDNPGYNRSQVISVFLPFTIDRAKKVSLMLAMKQDFLSKPGIVSVSAASQTVVNIGSSCTGCASWAGRDTSLNVKIAQLSADADFQQTMQLQMKEGRWFRNDEGTQTHGVILNETAVQTFGLKQPVTGQTFIFKGDTGQVLGVVKDFSYKSLHEKTGPLIVFGKAEWRNQFVVRTASGNMAGALSSLRQTWARLLPSTPFEYSFLDDAFNNMYQQDAKTSLLILIFALLAIVISALGLFSLATLEAQQRTKEIGIRKVLGASIAGITTLLSKDFIKLIFLSIIIASPLAWWMMQQWLDAFAYRISIGWWMFVAAGAIALLVAITTISIQAIKAAMVNPAKSLRTQ